MKKLILLILLTLKVLSEDLVYLNYQFKKIRLQNNLITLDNEKINFILDIKNENYEKINKFIFEHEDIDFNVKNKNTPLFYAIDLGNLKVVQLLIKYGANIHHINSNLETTLHISVKTNNVKIVRLLLKYDIEISAKDINGNTAIFYAKKNAFNKIIELLQYSEKTKKIENNSLEEFISNFNH
jgi:ankyrin repeat protein